jgi:hypothetical protein
MSSGAFVCATSSICISFLMTHGTLLHTYPDSLPINSIPPEPSGRTCGRVVLALPFESALFRMNAVNSWMSMSLESSLGRTQVFKFKFTFKFTEGRFGFDSDLAHLSIP